MKKEALQNEIEQSTYNFQVSSRERLAQRFELYKAEVQDCLSAMLVLPAYEYVLKCSHTFNLMDARGMLSRDERTNHIMIIRRLAEQVANCYVEQRKALGFPLLQK
jgi:glycyl-tRNA synthetase alpha chain